MLNRLLPMGFALAGLCAFPAQPGAAAPAGTNQAVIASAVASPGTLSLSLRNELSAATDRALNWLAGQQRPDGSWSDTNYPALTAMPLWAFARSAHPRKEAVTGRAVKFILSCVQTNGGIYREIAGRKGGGLSNYNTAICMTALHATGDRSLAPVILSARTFLAGAQHTGDDVYDGGFGYDKSTGRAYTDLLNSHWAATAMRLTSDTEDLRPAGERRAEIDWSRVVKFIERQQNSPESGDQAGGMAYNPTDPKAGTVTNREGVVFFRSYGSMTYAGLLSLIYADVSPEDVRVLSAYDWARRHWSLDENPGMGVEGLYFFYNVMTRALSAMQRDSVPMQDGTLLNWRAKVAEKLISLQRHDTQTGQGYWVNESNRYQENDKVLVTAYVLLAIESL